MDKQVLQKWLKAGYVENRNLFATEAGTPQGGIISPTLANVTLDGLEAELTTHFRRSGRRQAGIQGQSRAVCRRLCHHRRLARVAGAGSPSLGGALSRYPWPGALRRQDPAHAYQRRVRLPRPTPPQIRWQTAVTPSKKNTHAFKAKVKELFAEHKTAKQENLIGVLNPVIRGWANYHRAVVHRRPSPRSTRGCGGRHGSGPSAGIPTKASIGSKTSTL